MTHFFVYTSENNVASIKPTIDVSYRLKDSLLCITVVIVMSSQNLTLCLSTHKTTFKTIYDLFSLDLVCSSSYNVHDQLHISIYIRFCLLAVIFINSLLIHFDNTAKYKLVIRIGKLLHCLAFNSILRISFHVSFFKR